MSRSLAVCLVALFMLSVPMFGQEPNDVGPFMKAKLDHAKKILEGLTVEDFDQVAKSAQELSLISQATGWQVLQTPEYRDHSTDFRRSVEKLRDAAKKRNLDAATLAYVGVTLKCIECHKYVRNTKPVGAEDLLRVRLPATSPVDAGH